MKSWHVMVLNQQKNAIGCLLFLFLSLSCFNVVMVTNKHCDKVGSCNEEEGKPKIFEQNDSERFQDTNNLPPLNDAMYLIPDDKHPQVLWWYDHIFPHRDNMIECSVGTCAVTKDQKELRNPLTRGIIFYGTSFYADDLPLPRLPHHEWLLLHEESPKNNWMFSDKVGISLFNHTATFRRESDYPLSTQFMLDPDTWFQDTYFVSTSEKNRLQRDHGFAPAVYVQRDCNPPSDRDTYVKELMKYMKIDSFGPCLNNKKMPEELDGFTKLHSKPYYQFLANYKFQIAFENAICPDYMTEKVFRPLEIGSVPVYFGSPKIQDFMPSDHAIILAKDFKSPEDLAKFLLEMNKDDAKYDEYLNHRVQKKITNPELFKSLEREKWTKFGWYMWSGLSCYLCDELHTRNNMLKEHLKDSSKPIKSLKMADSNHMGCPIPESSMKDNSNSFYLEGWRRVFDYGRHEANALLRMLQANETDSKQWKTYLKMKTDKYPH